MVACRTAAKLAGRMFLKFPLKRRYLQASLLGLAPRYFISLFFPFLCVYPALPPAELEKPAVFL
jgi:hypothetical protein